jgi:acyl-coenzyme A thioesterase PaaI-like protein
MCSARPREENDVSDDAPAARIPILTQWEAAQTPASGAWAQKRRLAAAMRLVIGRLVESNAPEAELAAAADGLERYAERLATHPRLRRLEGFAESATAGDVAAFFDQSPVIGLSNPLAPPISVRRSGELSAEAHARFGAAYEGPPGCVHGGWVAAAFDEVLGFVQSTTGQPGMTGTLTIRYRKPTPLNTDLRFEATVQRIEGRKIFAEGRLYNGDVLTAEADGIFISVDLMKMRMLVEAQQRRGQ